MSSIIKTLIVLFFLFQTNIILSEEGNFGKKATPVSNNSRTSIQLHSSTWDYYDQYGTMSSQKAIYIAVDDPYTYEGWAGGHGESYGTLANAKARALEECNGSRQDWSISSPCLLFAENDNFVYGEVPAENPTPVIPVTPINTSSTYPTLSTTTLDIFIPLLKIEGYQDMWLDLKFVPASDGTPYWTINNLGYK